MPRRVNSGDPDATEEKTGEGVANAVARFSPRSRVRVGETVEVAVATENLHFFDRRHPRGDLVLTCPTAWRRTAHRVAGQPLTEPARMPRTKKRCSRKNTHSGTTPG